MTLIDPTKVGIGTCDKPEREQIAACIRALNSHVTALENKPPWPRLVVAEQAVWPMLTPAEPRVWSMYQAYWFSPRADGGYNATVFDPLQFTANIRAMTVRPTDWIMPDTEGFAAGDMFTEIHKGSWRAQWEYERIADACRRWPNTLTFSNMPWQNGTASDRENARSFLSRTDALTICCYVKWDAMAGRYQTLDEAKAVVRSNIAMALPLGLPVYGQFMPWFNHDPAIKPMDAAYLAALIREGFSAGMTGAQYWDSVAYQRTQTAWRQTVAQHSTMTDLDAWIDSINARNLAVFRAECA